LVNTRAFLGTVAALSLAAACPAEAQVQVQVSQSGWQWGNPTPQGNTIRAMDFTPEVTYAVGDAGTGLRSDDGGTNWVGLATGTTANLQRVQAVTADVVIAQDATGCAIRRSEDGGRTFRKIYILAEANCPDPVQVSYFVDPAVGYLVLRDGTVLRTTDGGDSFGRTQTAVPTPGSATATPCRPTRSSPAPTPAWCSSPAAALPTGPPTPARPGSASTPTRGTSGASSAWTPRRSTRSARTRSCAPTTAASPGGCAPAGRTRT
jgi:hypothetical protein